jgi:ABC-2 type transport system ATP-binding protein
MAAVFGVWARCPARRWTLSVQELVSIEPGAEQSVGTLPGAPASNSKVETSSVPRGGDARVERETVLAVKGLSKSFRSGFLRRKEGGIENVSFEVKRGSVFALLGHNGAGKTTTINSILDLIHPDQGQVEIFGLDHRRQEARSKVGFLPERPYFFEHLTGRELLSLYADLLDLPAERKESRIAEVLDLTRMAQAAGRRLRKYSKGMLQRIGLAQALLGDPDLLILDEPMSGLDPVGRREVRQLLQDLKAQGKTIILSSHIVPDVEKLADEVCVLKQGRKVESGPLDPAAAAAGYQVRIQAKSAPGSEEFLTVDDVDSLRELLDCCHEEGTAVLAVEPCRHDLEDRFLKALEQTEEVV